MELGRKSLIVTTVSLVVSNQAYSYWTSSSLRIATGAKYSRLVDADLGCRRYTTDMSLYRCSPASLSCLTKLSRFGPMSELVGKTTLYGSLLPPGTLLGALEAVSGVGLGVVCGIGLPACAKALNCAKAQKNGSAKSTAENTQGLLERTEVLVFKSLLLNRAAAI